MPTRSRLSLAQRDELTREGFVHLEEVGLELDGPTEAIEPLLFVTKSPLDRLLGRIVQERRALAELRIIVTLDDRSVVTHRLAPPVPTLDGRALRSGSSSGSGRRRATRSR